jgi:uncharacterized protein YqeY
MTLEAKINDELKNSIKSGDKIRIETLRSIRASIIEFNKSGVGREMNPDDELKILNSAAKKRKDAIVLYEQGNRNDLADKEKQELSIIEEYLPKQLSDDEVKNVIMKIKNEMGVTDIKDLGKLMGPVMKELKGKADGAKVQQFVRELLSSTGS